MMCPMYEKNTMLNVSDMQPVSDRLIIEICCNSIESVQVAEKYKADRIELCEALCLDGLTPSEDLIERVCTYSSIPVHVLIRPRAGDFYYSDEELDIIERQIQMVKAYPVAGIVVGHLMPEGIPNRAVLNSWRSLAGEAELTFHRAFDKVSDPFNALELLIESGFDRILTSGLESRAELGMDLLKELREKAGQRITIMPGGGIHHLNVHHFKNEGFEAVHLSAKPLNWPARQEPVIDSAIVKEVMSIARGH